MWTLNAQKHGGQLTSILMKKRAQEKYDKNPIICLNCLKIIPLNGRRPSKVKKRKFCSTHCSAVFNNKKYPKREASPYNKNPTSLCKICGALIYLKKRTKNTFLNRKVCDSCLKPQDDYYWLPDIGSKTKKEIFLKYKNWQSARSIILKHAIGIYLLSGRPKQCAVCKYEKKVQISHVRSVSGFSDDTIIALINDINNLVPLCPTHHWEFDHQCLENLKAIDDFFTNFKEQRAQGSSNPQLLDRQSSALPIEL